MADIVTFAAEARERAGKGTARATRRTGRVPSVIYGGSETPANISLELTPLLRELHKGGFQNRLFDIAVAGKTQRVLPRDVQFHPVTDLPIHVDFMRVTGSSRIRIWIPVHFTGQELSPGIKRGGVLNVVRHEIEFFCSPESIPDSITIDLKAAEIGDSIHINDLALPGGIKPVIDRNFTVATLAPPSGAEAEAAAATPAADAKAPAGKAAPAAKAAAPAKGGAAPAAKAPAAKAPAGKK